jgi:hypothetical protein
MDVSIDDPHMRKEYKEYEEFKEYKEPGDAGSRSGSEQG